MGIRADPDDCGAADGASAAPERWWGLLWFVWGVALATLIDAIDGNAWASTLATLLGFAIGQVGPAAVRPFVAPFHAWYQAMFGTKGEGEEEYLIWLLMHKREEFVRRTVRNDLWVMSLLLAPVFGLIHGTLAGPIAGALAALDPELEVTATHGALLGVLFGLPIIAATAAVVLAVDFPRLYASDVVPRWKQHCLLLVSPVFFLPAALHAVCPVLRKLRSAA